MTDLPDDETIRVRRTPAVGGPAPDDASDDTLPAEPTRRRATYSAGADEGPSDGSTIIARRESRRRAARDASAPRAEAPGNAPALSDANTKGRTAAAPDAASRAAYGARAPEPVVVARSAPPPRLPQAPVDGAAVEAARHRKGRRAALIVVLGACAVAIAAAASLLAIALNP